jgi:hypothetical protein
MKKKSFPKDLQRVEAAARIADMPGGFGNPFRYCHGLYTKENAFIALKRYLRGIRW